MYLKPLLGAFNCPKDRFSTNHSPLGTHLFFVGVEYIQPLQVRPRRGFLTPTGPSPVPDEGLIKSSGVAMQAIGTNVVLATHH